MDAIAGYSVPAKNTLVLLAKRLGRLGVGGQQDRGFTHLGLVAHAKRAAGHYEVAAVKPLQQRMLTLLD